MLFVEARFLLFFLAAFLVHWALRGNRSRKLWLLACSYAFYGAWDWRFLFLILASTVIDFAVGLRLPRATTSRRRRLWLAASLTANLSILGFFKYAGFFATSGAAFLNAIGLPCSAPTLSIILPVGISFFTFQTMSYTIDVYRGLLEPRRGVGGFFDFALFVSFFPQLVAGPIVRAIHFLPQLDGRRLFASVPVRAALTLFLLGFIKKACIADQVAAVVDSVFSQAGTPGLLDHWLATCLYTIQIYCDFSGYSDMAIATAALLGYGLPENFAFPYLARNITVFWRRWHISLSTWFRDYLYIPLGGNRSKQGRTLANLLLVFFLCGLWHGAAWNFVLWGLYHGAFLVLERLGRGSSAGERLGARLARLPAPLASLYTLLVVMVGWVLFRAESLGDVGRFLAALVGARGTDTVTAVAHPAWWLLVAGFALVHWRMADGRVKQRIEQLDPIPFGVLFGISTAIALAFTATGHVPFIYFQF
jgi:alginate O-acetyltransferase complex protein AlgI